MSLGHFTLSLTNHKKEQNWETRLWMFLYMQLLFEFFIARMIKAVRKYLYGNSACELIEGNSQNRKYNSRYTRNKKNGLGPYISPYRFGMLSS